jgi:hypothetical protein
MSEISLAEMMSPDDTVIVDGVASHLLAVLALEYTNRDPELVQRLHEVLTIFGLTPDTDYDEVEGLQTFESDPYIAQQKRGVIHDSLLAYLLSDQIPDEYRDDTMATIQTIRCQSAINN